MTKKQFMTLLALGSLCFVGCGDSNKKSYLAPQEEDIQLKVSLERNTTSKHPLDIVVKLKNLSGKTIYYENNMFPENTKNMIRNFFIIMEDNIEVPYSWINAYPIAYTFNTIKAGETLVKHFSIDKLYKVHKGHHNYNISIRYKDIRAKTTDNRPEAFTESDYTTLLEEEGYSNILPPEEATSKNFYIESSSLDFNATIHTIRKMQQK